MMIEDFLQKIFSVPAFDPHSTLGVTSVFVPFRSLSGSPLRTYKTIATMSTKQTEDEWQAVEENLKALSIKEQVQSKQNKSADQSGDDNGLVESIDTALMNALLNPRERMVLFHIEDAILNFMKSNDRQMDLPQCNSFRRLLYYRLGQRFGLCHTTTDQITETGERTIVLYKTATSCFPTVLLIDLAAQYPLDPSAALDGGNYNNNNNANGNNYNSGKQSPTPSANQLYSLQNPANNSSANRKVQVMKRKPARTDTSSTKSNTNSKNAQSAEDKEKAYHEARARIFGDTGTPEGSTGGNSPCPYDDGEGNSNSGMCTPQSEVHDTKNVTNSGNNVSGSGSVVDNNSTTGTRGSTPVNSSAALSNQSSSASLSALGGEKSNNASTKESNAAGIAEKRTATEPPTVTSRTSPLSNDTSYNNNTNNHNNRRNNTNNNNNNNSRAQVRNIDAERSDPDFVRRCHVNRNPSGGGNDSSGGNYYNNSTSGGGNGYNNHNYNQSRQQADPRYNMTNISNNANMAYSVDPQALYLQQQQQLQMQMQMQYNTMQQQQQQGLPPAGNTPEAVQMQLQMQMQYQQMQLQMQMLAQQQQQQQMMMGANPYYPNNMPAPQGYNMPNGQSSPVPPPPYGPGYVAPYNNSNNNNNTNGAPQYNRVNNSSNNNRNSRMQYKNEFPPLG